MMLMLLYAEGRFVPATCLIHVHRRLRPDRLLDGEGGLCHLYQFSKWNRGLLSLPHGFDGQLDFAAMAFVATAL